ncbi:cytochrome P450 [Coniophora puteana RWD-64-598 SS2]|uniref:Cytochrome P450 n=1 Tax=Coniophora puteana (strain RWD-64-598) TaxID=741705 RepID=R7SG41_CONPW|nr:cytochrome P450 [Coniophora puteana RWD-64-598 SS2]EIW74059.1 cytochrome P450 [Coniophora puteana RWD-64-598 SS2]
MNPAFGPAHIRALTDIFNAKSVKLRDTLMDEIRNIASSNGIDVTVWLSRMTLDAIGLAGFNYSFDALNVNERPNELSEAFNHMVQTAQDINLLTVLQGFIPPLRVISTAQTRVIKKSQQTMTRIGRHLLRDAKAAIRAESDTKTIEKSNVKGKDLLSLLVRANTATDIPDSQRMDDEDVLAQVPTFLAAGHETTSTATTWALYALTQNKAAQTKLRDELLTMDTENPSMDALNALPYLDMVVRETLRLHAPVANSIRVATKDDVIPLETPVVDRYGVQRHEIRIQKGDSIWVPILAVNRSKEIWGEDAHEFRPERWESTPEAAHQIPGVWGNMLTFIGGPRACIGYRFSLVEMKSLLFALVRAFEFDLAVPASEVSKRNVVVTRPLITSDPEEGRQFRLPLIIRPFVRD